MKTILVVDDMAIIREPIEAALKANGFNVVMASNGVEACTMISQSRPDLVVLDLEMPVMNGLRVLRWIRNGEATRHLPVIVLSAERERSRVLQAATLGISGYLLKAHFSLTALLESVTKAMTPITDSPSEIREDVQSAPQIEDRVGTPPGQESDRSPSDGAPVTPIKPLMNLGAARDEDLKAHRPLVTRSDLLARMRLDEELEGFSPTVTQVLQITADEECSMEQVARVVSRDHAVALKVMRLANSALYSRGDRVDTVQKAVMRIGMQNIRRAVLNIGVVERFSSVAFEEHMSTQQFWEHSIACGIISAELAKEFKHADSDVAFTTGLLHDLGRLLYADRMGEEYVKVLDVARDMSLPLERVETRLLLMDHAQVMEHVLHAWNFPKELVCPIVFHHKEASEIRAAAPHQLHETLTLGLADRLAHAMMLGGSGNDMIYPTEDHCRCLSVPPEVIDKIVKTAGQQTDDTKFALLATSGNDAWPRSAEQHRADLQTTFAPLVLSESPGIDAYLIFCQALSGLDFPEKPNIAVVHFTSVKDRGPLAARLAEAESELGISGLPVIMLSPGGRLTLDESVLMKRPAAVLGTPTPIAQFIAAVNQLLSAENKDLRNAA